MIISIKHLPNYLFPVGGGAATFPTCLRKERQTTIHTHIQAIFSRQFTYPPNACLWTVGGSWRTMREPTQTQGKTLTVDINLVTWGKDPRHINGLF